ncbi:MAG TPA: class I tRNA ligase family protein [Kofleriaceae bacterium]|nr:class I tRNA ligase family protein [Kofleriaceae bacterium]
MLIRKFSRADLESEPHSVLFRDLYPWDAIEDTPFGASLAVVEPGGRTMRHNHDPAETFIICSGRGTMSIGDEAMAVGPGDVVYMQPRVHHDLRNDSATDDLVFVSIFWDATVASETDASIPRLVIPSPPTANGPLHLGHLAGPYLLADVTTRYYRSRGAHAQTICLTDENQSYVADRALHVGIAPGELAAQYATQIVDTLRAFSAAPDVVVHSARDAEYRAAVQARFAALHAAGKLVEETHDAWYCERCELALFDAFVVGDCPRCTKRTFGAMCETCCSPNRSFDLGNATCDRCQSPAVRRAQRQLMFPLAPYADALAAYHARLRLTPKLRRFAAQWLEAGLPAVPASESARWGIPTGLAGFEDQIISPWLEVALASPYLRERHGATAEVTCCFGYDNAFLYLVEDPAAALALDPAAKLPVALGVNEFLLLDQAKMSTSQGHVLDARALLAQVPADLLRLFLAKVRPEDMQTSANLQALHMFVNLVPRYWQDWLETLGTRLAMESASCAPQPANASLQPWSDEQLAFLAQLKAIVARARTGYESLSMKEVSLAIGELVDRAVGFGAAQAQLAGIPSLHAQRSTGLALELAAARTLAMIVAPVMPGFGAQLWHALGERDAVTWSDDVGPVPTGQRVDTQAMLERRFFPPVIALA